MSSSLVLLVAADRAHVTQLWSLRPWWVRREHLWVSYPAPGVVSLLRGEDVRWARPKHRGGGRRAFALPRELALALRVSRRHRPAVVVATGTGLALAFVAAARLARIPTVYVEPRDRVRPSPTARMCRLVTRLHLTQWEEQRDLGPGAITVGPLL